MQTMESNASLRAILNDLIQTCKDGQEGFLTAAENVAAHDIKALFNEYSLQRAKFVGELQTAAFELGNSDPEDASTVPGAVHRGWINLKSAIVHGDAHAILLECERGERSAVCDYNKVLKLEVPANIREMLSRQHTSIVAAHERVRVLADAGAPKWA